MIRQAIELDVRHDRAGSGDYGADRDSHKHRGIDYACTPGEPILSPVAGRVTKHGYPYGDDLTWRYVQITDAAGLHHRLFYVDPTAPVGTSVEVNQPVGDAQDVSKRYPGQGMLPHVHYEVMDDKGEHRDPSK